MFKSVKVRSTVTPAKTLVTKETLSPVTLATLEKMWTLRKTLIGTTPGLESLATSDDDGPDGMLAYINAIKNPDKTDPTWPLPSFDGRDWAEAFVEKVKVNPNIATDEGTMLAWFCGSLMRGFDECMMRMANSDSK